MYKILITGSIHPIGVEMLQHESDLEVDFRPDLPLPEILEIIEPYHCLITRSETPIQKDLIDRASNLKVIARAAVGIANIDVDHATEKGILVINTPGKNTNSAAELTLALLLAVTRNVVSAHKNMEQGNWNRHKFMGTELLGKTIGIIGLGNVGHRVARFANGFDMRVLAYDPYIADGVFKRHNAEKVDFDTLLKESDVITAHTPKTSETIGMLDAKAIKKMKPGVILLNAARGGIIDEPALLEGLQSKHVAGAGIDTWTVEPVKDNPFKDFPQIVMAPHIGASTAEAQIRIAETVAAQVPRALRGEVVDYPVNMPQIRLLDGDLSTSYTVLSEKLGKFAAQYIDFVPNHLEIQCRGKLAHQDCSLLRLGFLKGYFQSKHTQDYVSYVNADHIAHQVGLYVTSAPDPGFTDYESAIKFSMDANGRRCQVGGVVFSGPHPRITFVDGFVFEIDPKGTVLLTKNNDRPGMIGRIGQTLGDQNINIAQFELSRNRGGGEAMSLIRVDDDVSEEVLESLRQADGITYAKKIVI